MNRDTELVKCDCIVVGAGPAGIAASISAARAGAHVVLLEKYGFLGGLASAGMVGTVCGLYIRDTSRNVEYVSGGFAMEFAEEIQKVANSRPLHATDGLYVLPCDAWDFQKAAEGLVKKTGRIDLVLHSTLVSVNVKESVITNVDALVWDRVVSFMTSSVVDCTGEATVLYMAGAPVVEDTYNQAAAVVFSMENVDASEPGSISMLRDIRRAVNHGHLSSSCGQVSFVPSGNNEDKVYLKVNLDYQASSSSNKMTELELRAHGVINELSHFICRVFGNARLSRIPPQVGIRSGRRADGRTVLTEEDILQCRKFTDGVACGSWPMEQWGKEVRPRMTYMPEREYYEIPVGCLIPKTLENVFVAGRCISSTTKAIASARVIGTALSTGWAAGKAAAFRSEGRPLSAAVEAVRKEQVRGVAT